MVKAASGLSKALTRPPSHGGHREGAGRKTILDRGIKRTFVLTESHLDQIDAWGRAHNIDTRSAALRHLIESAIRISTLLAKTVEPHHPMNCPGGCHGTDFVDRGLHKHPDDPNDPQSGLLHEICLCNVAAVVA